MPKTKLKQDYNVVLIHLTDNLHSGSRELVINLKDRQPIDGNVLTEVYLLHYEDNKSVAYDSVKLFELIVLYCNDFNASSVYIFGEDEYLPSIENVFKSGNNRLDKNCLVKFIKSTPSLDINELSIILHGQPELI